MSSGSKYGLIGENFLGSAATGDQADGGANGDARPAKARLATHDVGIKGYAVKLGHARTSTEKGPKRGEKKSDKYHTERPHQGIDIGNTLLVPRKSA